MKLLVVSGGRHPYEESTPILESFLKGAGHDVTVTEDASALADASVMSGYDVLVFNTRRENVPDFGDWTLTADQMDGLKGFISGGKGFVCIHIATCVAAAWPEYHDITGGGWISGTSYHPPYGHFTVNVSQAEHPGCSGIGDFDTNDELYMNLAIKDGNNVFITGTPRMAPGPGVPTATRPTCPAGRIPWAGPVSTATATCSCCCWDTTAAVSRRRSSSASC